MAEVKWIKLKVGMFDGMSFKKIKRAKIGGESFRDKLTAIWFELMDFAGKCNQNGSFISPRGIPFTDLSDIATMIDREVEELELCMGFYINEGMVSIVEDVYMLSNWSEYQNVDGLEKIREQNRIRKQNQRKREKLLAQPSDNSVTCHVTVTQSHATDKEKELDKDKELDKSVCVDTALAQLNDVVDIYHFDFNVKLALMDWMTYKAEREESYTDTTLRTMLSMVERYVARKGSEAVANLITECIASGYKNIVFDRLDK